MTANARKRWRLAATVALGVIVAAALPASTGATDTLKELGCISESRSGHDAACTNGKGLSNAAFLAVSGDGRFVYVTGRESDSVATFARDARTGGLKQLAGTAGCISDSGSGHDPDCATGNALDRASGIAVSPDSQFVYVAANYGNGVAIFRRDATTGALTQTGCVAEQIPACTKGTGLRGAIYPAISPDGRNLYLASGTSNSIVTFARDVTTGALTERNCLTDATHPDLKCTKVPALDDASSIAVSADGKNVYVSSPRSSAVTSFARNAGTGALTEIGCISGDDGYRQDPACARGIGLQFAQFVSITSDGKNVYAGATDSHTVVGFARNASTGALTQLPVPEGCVEDFDNGTNPCSTGFGLALPLAVVPTPDGTVVYVGSFGYGTVSAFRRDPATGYLKQFGPCISESDSRCDRGKGLNRAGFLALSPDGRHVYVNAPASNAVAIFGRAQFPNPPLISGRRGKILKKKAVRLRLTCVPQATTGCFGSIRLVGLGKAKRLRLGPVQFDIPGGQSANVVLKGNKRSARVLRRQRKFKAKAMSVTREPAGDSQKTVLYITVRR